jgi:hypothetical protein
MWPREDARQVPGLGGSAEERARRWRSGGGRGSSGSGDRATVTPEFESKLECINYMCARIKLHTHVMTQ